MPSRLKSRLLHYAMNNSLFAGERTALVSATQGRVLEVCFETDKNLPYYSPWVTDLTLACVEGAPAPPRHDTTNRGLRVERISCGSAALMLPFENARFDWVVTTLALCRMNHRSAMLAEMRRVLKPSGAYLFLEHGRSPDPALSRWQDRLRERWLQYGGCELALPIDEMIRAAGFRIDSRERYQLGQPKFLSSMYRGRAQPA